MARVNGNGLQPGRAEVIRHVVGVAHRAAKADRGTACALAMLFQRIQRARFGRQGGVEGGWIELPGPPWDLRIVDIVRHTEIVEWRQVPRVDPAKQVALVDKIFTT